MNKLFRRYHQGNLEKRSGVFIKRQEESRRLDSQRQFDMEALSATPKIELDDLSDIESNAYQTWWKDLDPFHIGKANNEAVFNFVSGCGLPDYRLEEILALFQNQKQELTKEQFFAILRLIAHAQNGRTINRDTVYLGAPLPRFQTQAIDAIIKRSQPNEAVVSKFHDSTSNHSSISANSSEAGNKKVPSWMTPMNKATGVQPTMLPQAILGISKLYTQSHVSHSRSRSVPYNFLSKMDDSSNRSHTNNESHDLPSKLEPRRSMDADSLQKMMNTEQSLLLTQGFQPKFNDGADTASVNSNESRTRCKSYDKTEEGPNNYNPYLTATNANPFETDDSSSTTPTQTPTILSQTANNTLNICMNSEHIPPPPVPPQSTKPTYPKYARRTHF
ncbi:hypothetical protein BD408DRAFT_45085 [Parasitella parasitica]|nr:hypothetical protein BD408DRAFT_45085 [Parasitella parasitica]